jgi:heme-degrading monooxygenase HmoA
MVACAGPLNSQGIRMIICLIEFEVMPGMEAEQQKWLKELLPIVDAVPGFRGKESYVHVSGDGRTNTVSLWDDEDSLAAWVRDPRHREAMAAGKDHVFSRYEIRICSQLRHYEHIA